MTRVIAVTGGKGGVGKTNISLNLALCLSKLDTRVALFDADLGLANINILLGLYPEYHLDDVISNKKSIRDIVIKDYQGVDIIPGSSGVERIANLDQENVKRLISSFSELDEYDFFILDTSSGISRNVISFCLAASEVVVVITPEPTSLTDAYALLKVLSLNGLDGEAKIVVNQCQNTTVASQTYNKFKDVVKKYLPLDISPLGIVVQDKRFPEAVRKQQPLVSLYPESSAAKCFKVMAARLVANQPEDFRNLGLSSFWTRFLEFARGPLQTTEKPEAEKSDADVAGEPERKPASGAAGRPLAPAQQPVQPMVSRRPPADEQRQPPHEYGAPKKKPSNRLLAMIESSRDLPTLPHILLKMLEICGNGETSIKDLSAVVQKDPSLSAHILRMVNSAYYNFPQKITSFRQAIGLVGMESVKNMAMSAAVYQVFFGLQKNPSFNLKVFWWHSFMCAVIAEMLAQKTAYPRPDEAFLAGLLHDIGKLVLMENFPHEYAAAVRSAQNESQLFAEEERQLGISHADTGFWLMNKWRLQSFVADAILYHHEPAGRIANAFPLVKIIHVANSLCSIQADSRDAGLSMAMEMLGLDPADTAELTARAEQQVDQIATSFEIDIEAPQQADTYFSERDIQIQADLAGRVRDISLLQGTLQNLLNAQDIPAILKTALQGMRILFDAHELFFFLYDEPENVLAGMPADEGLPDDTIRGLTIPCREGTSMLVTVLQQRRICDSFSPESPTQLTIIDEQLIRLLGKEGIICFPLAAQGQPVGVIVLGVDGSRAGGIMESSRLIKILLTYAALALHAERVRQGLAKKILAERLAAATAVARKVAHEVNNPLSIIKNYLKILQMNLSEHDIPIDELRILNEEIDRVSLIISQLSDFSQPRAVRPEPVDINGLLQDIVTLTGEPLQRDNIRVHLDLDGSLPLAMTARDSLKQVFINLIKNAAEAIQSGGDIFINTKHAPESNAAEIVIRDTGPGISEAVKSRLYEPYISTKGEGHTGMGLSIVYNTVQELHGTIACSTAKDKGAIFTITLPLSAGKR